MLGKPGPRAPAALRLAESAAFPQDAVHLAYERVGQPAFGGVA